MDQKVISQRGDLWPKVTYQHNHKYANQSRVMTIVYVH